MKTSVLIVDDDGNNRKLLAKVLHTKDYNVLEAENGEAAIKIIQSELIDVVILDIMMPGMNGYEVCEKIKTNLYTKDIPVIMLTGKGMDQGLVEAARKKANFYIEKPYDYKVLLAQIETTLEKSRKRTSVNKQPIK